MRHLTDLDAGGDRAPQVGFSTHMQSSAEHHNEKSWSMTKMELHSYNGRYFLSAPSAYNKGPVFLKQTMLSRPTQH